MQVWRHTLGTAQSHDTLIYEEQDSGWFTHIHESASGRFCVIAGGDHETSEQRLVDLPIPTRRDPDRRARGGRAVRRRRSRRSSCSSSPTRMERSTSRSSPRRWRAGPRQLARSHCASRRRLHHRHRTLCQSSGAARARRTRCPRSSFAISRDGDEHAIAFDEAAYSLDTMGGYEFDTTNLRFAYSSMTTPRRSLRLRHGDARAHAAQEQKMPSGHDPADYVTTRIFAPRRRRRRACRCRSCIAKDMTRDGSAPLPVLRLRLLRHGDAGVVLRQSAVAGRSRVRLCDRACPRRHRQGLGLVSRRQAREQDQHLRRFHRLRASADRGRIHVREGESSRTAARPAAC